MCLMAAFVPHRPNKYFHVTASNGIVSNSSYTPLAIMTASPIASVRLFDPRCRCRLATFAALPTPSMIERAIIMLTDHRFFGDMLLAPHRQVRRSHRSIHCWHGHAARRSELPRERFSPLTAGHNALTSIASIADFGYFDQRRGLSDEFQILHGQKGVDTMFLKIFNMNHCVSALLLPR